MVSKRIVAPQRRREIRAVHIAIQAHVSNSTSIRKCAKTHNVSYSSLWRALNHNTTLLPRGRPPIFSKEEEQLLVDSALYFSSHGTPLSRECMKDLIHTFVISLPPQRQQRIPFSGGRPGDGFLRGFIRRHTGLTLRRRCSLEKARQLAMSPTNLASHYARLHQAYREFKIHNPEQVFNIDESGFSTRTASRARSKALFDSSARRNSTELKWKANAEHVTVMPVVSGDGRSWRPLVVLPGKHSKYRTRSDGSRETPAAFLPPNAYCVYREKAGVDSEIFYQWALKFVEETEDLRKKHRHIVVTMDAYGAHCTYRVLKLFRENRIVAVGLPAHSSHRTQVLDYSVFSPFKTSFRNMINRRAYTGCNTQVNDIYTLCEMLTRCYYDAVRCENTVSGFTACGVWNRKTQSADASVIRQSDVTNWEGATSQEAAYRTYKDLVEAFKTGRKLLRSDGEVIRNGTLATTSGALLTNEDVLFQLCRRDEGRREAAELRNARAAEATAGRAARAAEAAEKQRQKEAEEERRRLHFLWLSERFVRCLALASSRTARRRRARLRAVNGDQAIEGTH